MSDKPMGGIIAALIAVPVMIVCCAGAAFGVPFLAGVGSWLAGLDTIYVMLAALLALLAFLIVKTARASRRRRHPRQAQSSQ